MNTIVPTLINIILSVNDIVPILPTLVPNTMNSIVPTLINKDVPTLISNNVLTVINDGVLTHR